MNTAGRLGLFAGGAVVAFVSAFGVAAAVTPGGPAAAVTPGGLAAAHTPGGLAAAQSEGEVMSEESAPHSATTAATPAGVSVSQGGYVLSPVTAPATTGEPGELSFQILTTAGKPVTDFAVAHEKDLHLIVVRADGAAFRHVHPVLDETTGTWSLPWAWDQPGSYRVYTDFTPGGEAAEGVTLTRTVQVAGDYQPVAASPSRSFRVDGYTASVSGDLVAGSTSYLTISIHRGAEPVTTLEPYLGAFGHLVALRDGDLAYLHVHADGDDPQPGDTSGPDIAFMAEAPTPGRYLLYLDFQVAGQVHTAEFVLDAAHREDTADSVHDNDSHSH